MTRAEAIELLSNDAFKLCMLQLRDPLFEACYKALNMAIKALEQDKVLCFDDLENKCKHCTVKGETKHYCYCDIWGSVVNPRGWCNYGERDEKEVEK